MIRCETCGATTAETARFCGQCYEVFTPTTDDEPTADATGAQWTAGPQDARPGDTGLLSPTPTPGPGRAARPVSSAQAGRFTMVDGQTIWTCAVCESQNPLEVFNCAVCGTRIDAEVGGTNLDGEDWARAARIEAMVPGLGHIRTGQEGMGYARLGMVLVWALGAIVLSFGGIAGVVTAVPLVVGVVAVWVTGPHDIRAALGSSPPRLDARRFMYLVIGVTMGVIVMGGLGVAL